MAAYVRALPTVLAEDSLTSIADGRVAALAATSSSARERIYRLQRNAERNRPKQPADPRTLRAAGIGVEFRNRKGE